MKKDRIISYILILLMYVASFFVGFIFYDVFSAAHLLIRVLILTTVTTFMLFIFSTFVGNSSVYEPYWSVFPMVLAFVLYNYGGCAHPMAYIMLVLIELWGLRLTINWAIRFKSLEHEDWRYTMFKEKYPRLWPIINLLGIHMFPTLIVYLIMLAPIEYFEAVNMGFITNQFNVSTIIAIFIAIGSIVIETIADAQSTHYRKKYPNQMLTKGLWKVSRHPNYFGEIVFWFALYLILISINDKMWILFLGPLANLLLFVFISIPMMEKRMLSKYPEYAEYKKNTNVLLIFPNKNK